MTGPLATASRVEENTPKRILRVLAEFETRSTSFSFWAGLPTTTPAIVKEIVDAGHEVGVHSYWHRLDLRFDARGVPRPTFADAHRRRREYRRQEGHRPSGRRLFRSRRKSLCGRSTSSARGGPQVRHERLPCPSSSIWHNPDAPRSAYEIRPGFWEFPIATARAFNSNIPGRAAALTSAYSLTQ